MAIRMNLAKIVELEPRFFDTLGQKTIRWITKRTQEGYGVKNKRLYKFAEYSEEYRKAKSRGMKRLTNRRGRKGTKVASLAEQSTDRQVSPPNFRLRGKTMDDLDIISVSKRHVTIGWRGEFANIVAAHEDKRKFIVGDLAEKEFDDIIDLTGQQIVKNWNRKVKNITVRVG